MKKLKKLARFYIDNSPKGVFYSALWTCSGSESNENTMKIIRQYQKGRGKPKKLKVITKECSYHGYTLGTMSLGSNFVSRTFQEFQKSDVFFFFERCQDVSHTKI